MKLRDRIDLGVGALRKQKLRTAITLLGVVIGTMTLVISVAVSIGVHSAIQEQFQKNDRLRRVEVFPQFQPDDDSFEGIPETVLVVRGEMSEVKQQRIRRQLARRWRIDQQRQTAKPLTPALIEQISQLPHVQSATPHLWESCRARFRGQVLATSAQGVRYDQKMAIQTLEVGRMPQSNDTNEVLVHEFALYQLGIVDDEQVQATLGSEVQLDFTNDQRASPLLLLRLFQSDASKLTETEMAVLAKAWQQLPRAVESFELTPPERELLRGVLRQRDPNRMRIPQKDVRATFRIVGVYRDLTKDERKQDFFGNGIGDAQFIIPLQTAETLFYQLPRHQVEATNRLQVMVDSDDHVEEVVKAVESLGLQTFSLVEIIQQVRTNVTLISFGLTFIALVALIVAALGITNTLYSSVLERTREIGIMKAVGASDGDVMSIFLIEGAIIGLIGGLTGLCIGYLVSIPSDWYAVSVMARQTREAAPETMFRFPIWLILGIPIFSTIITMLAAWYPARRAAQVEPVIALRYE